MVQCTPCSVWCAQVSKKYDVCTLVGPGRDVQESNVVVSSWG
jgi:hypothetical protein